MHDSDAHANQSTEQQTNDLDQRWPDADAVATVGGPVMADGGVVPAHDDGDLSRFQLEILYQLAATPDRADYGLGIKRKLEAYYDEEVNHGRLYPNLDTLVKKGLLDKSKLDKRTNQYALTDEADELLTEHARRRAHAIGLGDA